MRTFDDLMRVLRDLEEIKKLTGQSKAVALSALSESLTPAQFYSGSAIAFREAVEQMIKDEMNVHTASKGQGDPVGADNGRGEADSSRSPNGSTPRGKGPKVPKT